MDSDCTIVTLKPFQHKLEERVTQQEWYELQQPQAAYIPFFDRPKIVYPDIGKETRFSMDEHGYYVEATAFFIPIDNWYLLGVLNSAPAFEYLESCASVLGDEKKGGRIRFKTIYMETLPIPDAPTAEREAVAKLAKEAQQLHIQRRKRVEKFLHDIGTAPAESSSRNSLEQLWTLTANQFTSRARRIGTPDLRLFNTVRDETTELTERIERVEREIDERVAGLYGIDLIEEARKAGTGESGGR
ncbi:MAG: TaqI-like C-terminal specificity domain-containing protein [Candidatus Bipolaricaulia bacterium]